jgi:hypothetical protein
MPWTGEPGAGFTTGRPWIRIGPDAARRNVATQARDPDSVLACYRRLLAARRSLAALRTGSLRRLSTDDPDVLAWRRGDGPEAAVVIVNFATGDRRFRWAGDRGDDPEGAAPGGAAHAAPAVWRTVVGTHARPSAPDEMGEVALRGLEGVVLVRA